MKALTEHGDGIDRWIEDLDQMAHPTPSLKTRLDLVTRAFTEDLRASMPVRTGNLKRSGFWRSEMHGDIYEAEVQFGGVSAPYAPYVIGKGVDGEHRWDAVLPAYEHRFEEVFDAEIDL